MKRDLVRLGLFAAVLFGARLGARDLWNPNEPIYGEAVVEMARRGDWLVPHVNGLVFAEKPILFYWLARVAATILGGVSELSLRVPSLLAGIATVLGTYVLARPYAGRERALASGAACATLFGVFWNARFVQMDILVTATTLWTVLAIARVTDGLWSPLRGWLTAGAVAGVGFLAKGPVAWVGPALVVGADLLATRRLRALLRREVLAGAALCVAIPAPWFLALWAGGHTDVIHEVLVRQNFSRFSNPWDHAAPVWYYLEYFWIDMAPWSFFVPLALAPARAAEGERRLWRLSWLWIAAVVVFFSLSRSKRSPYILPIAPAVALLAGQVAIAFAGEALPAARRRAAIAIAAALAAALAIGGIGLVVVARRDHPDLATPATALSIVALAGASWIAATLLRGAASRRAATPRALVLSVAAFYLAAAVAVLPALDAYKSARPVAEEIARIARPGDRVASFDFWSWRSEYAYYLGHPIENLAGREALRDAWRDAGRLVLLVEADRLGEVRSVVGEAEPGWSRTVGGKSVYLFTNR